MKGGSKPWVSEEKEYPGNEGGTCEGSEAGKGECSRGTARRMVIDDDLRRVGRE